MIGMAFWIYAVSRLASPSKSIIAFTASGISHLRTFFNDHALTSTGIGAYRRSVFTAQKQSFGKLCRELSGQRTIMWYRARSVGLFEASQAEFVHCDG